MISLGIDPGYAITGWGVVSVSGKVMKAEGYGAILTDPSLSLPQRLHQVQNEIRGIIQEYRPDLLTVEKLYFGTNKTTAEGVLESRGVILAAAGEFSLNLCEVSPGTVKKAVTGSGNAGKKDVIHMIHRILDLKENIKLDDTCDALALALTGAFMNQGVIAQ